jgi:hypothetical protein
MPRFSTAAGDDMLSRPVETESKSPKDDLSLELLEAFDTFEGVQADLLLALRERPNKVLAQLNCWEEERHKWCAVICFLLERLKKELESRVCSGEEGQVWQGRLARLMEREGQIYSVLAREKLRLENELKKLRHGKHALKGYKSEAVDRRPAFCCQDA